MMEEAVSRVNSRTGQSRGPRASWRNDGPWQYLVQARSTGYIGRIRVSGRAIIQA